MSLDITICHQKKILLEFRQEIKNRHPRTENLNYDPKDLKLEKLPLWHEEYKPPSGIAPPPAQDEIDRRVTLYDKFAQVTDDLKEAGYEAPRNIWLRYCFSNNQRFLGGMYSGLCK